MHLKVYTANPCPLRYFYNLILVKKIVNLVLYKTFHNFFIYYEFSTYLVEFSEFLRKFKEIHYTWGKFWYRWRSFYTLLIGNGGRMNKTFSIKTCCTLKYLAFVHMPQKTFDEISLQVWRGNGYDMENIKIACHGILICLKWCIDSLRSLHYFDEILPMNINESKSWRS